MPSSKPYDLRTLEMVIAWCERQHDALDTQWKRATSLELQIDVASRAYQIAKLQHAMQRHAAKAKRGAR